MPAPNARQEIQEIPIEIVGGNKFGRYNKINYSQTWNMIVSDDFLVPYAGYKNVVTTENQGEGRGLYSSTRGDFMLAVIGSAVYRISKALIANQIGTLITDLGDVYIAENNNSQIAITDGSNVYVYNYGASPATFDKLNFAQFPYYTPGYISFQNGRLLIANTDSTVWVLSALNDATQWTGTGTYQGSLQTKPDFVQAAVPVPGGGSNLLLFGHTVTEQWQDVGNALFPYQKASTFDVDYGCLNPSTIATLKDFIVWLAINEQSGPTIMVCAGNQTKQISTDGIDYKLGNLTDPENCTAFLFQQDGHLLYQFTFITDNLTYAYDFNSGLFFSVSDQNLNYHPAREVVYFNNAYYFVSLNGGNVYLFDTTIPFAQYSDIDIQEIPRIRITPSFRLPTQRMFIIKSLSFTTENGQPNPIIVTSAVEATLPVTLSSSAVDLSISRDGAENFGNSYRLDMNPTGVRKSRFIFQRLGQANDVTFQLRFYGLTRWVVTNGLIEVYT
jgi:hypothetical protein